MTQIDFENYLKSNNTKISQDRVVSWMKLIKTILSELTGDSKDPFSNFNTLHDLEDYLENPQCSKYNLSKRISQGSGAGHSIMGHFIDVLKQNDPENLNNSSAIEQKIRDILKKHNHDGMDQSGNQPIATVRANVSQEVGANDTQRVGTNNTGVKNSGKAKEMAELLESAYNIILHGAPGTGKTYLAKEIAKKMGCSEQDGSIKMVQFHPSYDYTDFMEGLRPVRDKLGNIGFERKNGTFKEFCKKAIESFGANRNIIEGESAEVCDKTAAQKFVFIIDEINRGELSKILGECMFSIDPGYVGEQGRIETQYQNLITDDKDPFKNGFYRPENVYIIGTMNDIDRGVESMDLAMRRRFLFEEITAATTQAVMLNCLMDKRDMAIAERVMNALNDEIRRIPELGEDYCIGACYFLKLDNYYGSNENLKWKFLWERHLKGLLREYVRGLEDTTLLDSLQNIYDNAVDSSSK